MFEVKKDDITGDWFVYEDGHFVCMTAECEESAKKIVNALEKEAFFENNISVISEWFVDNKNCLLDEALKVGRDEFIESNVADFIDQVDLDFIIEEIVEKLQEGMLNVLSTFKND